MRLLLRILLLVLALVLAAQLPSPNLASAHPEDEICGPDSELDPELCAALSAMNSATAVPGALDAYGIAEDDRAQLRPWHETLALYVRFGFEHILPTGADHILFIVALVVTTPRWRGLILQVSAFTLAHTLTLGLAAGGVLPQPDRSLVDPLIAISIAFVAIEGLVWKQPPAWRPAIVFGFGLLHGFGFAGAFSGLGLPAGQFASGLVGFNVGVELGQLFVAALALLAIASIMVVASPGQADAFRRRWITLPVSALIGATGLYWAWASVTG